MTKSDVSIWFFVSFKSWFGWLTLLFLSEDTKTILKESIRVKAKSRKLYITRHVINHRKTKMALTLLSQFFFRLQSKWLWSAVSQWSLQKKYLLPAEQLRVGLLVIACWDQVKYEADSELWLLDFCWTSADSYSRLYSRSQSRESSNSHSIFKMVDEILYFPEWNFENIK